jgi:hypothetical protein
MLPATVVSITTEDGTELEANSDVNLARMWAEHEVNVRNGAGGWEALSFGQRCEHVSDALGELRRALAVAQEDE